MTSSRFVHACIAAATLALGGCSGYSPMSLPAGTSATDIRAHMGPPTASYARGDAGRRLEYAKGPFGAHTFMVDLDKDDRLVRSQQVLTRAHFAEVRVGMTRDELLYRIGHPAETAPLPRQKHDLWSYRFDSAPFCLWFQVSLDVTGRVVDTGYAPDPLCTPIE